MGYVPVVYLPPAYERDLHPTARELAHCRHAFYPNPKASAA